MTSHAKPYTRHCAKCGASFQHWRTGRGLDEPQGQSTLHPPRVPAAGEGLETGHQPGKAMRHRHFAAVLVRPRAKLRCESVHFALRMIHGQVDRSIRIPIDDGCCAPVSIVDLKMPSELRMAKSHRGRSESAAPVKGDLISSSNHGSLGSVICYVTIESRITWWRNTLYLAHTKCAGDNQRKLFKSAATLMPKITEASGNFMNATDERLLMVADCEARESRLSE